MGSLVHTLIKQGLGYCCPWAFFKIFRRTPEIAARLGVSDRTIQRCKRAVKEGELECEHCANCMKAQVRAVKVMGKKELGLVDAKCRPSAPLEPCEPG